MRKAGTFDGSPKLSPALAGLSLRAALTEGGMNFAQRRIIVAAMIGKLSVRMYDFVHSRTASMWKVTRYLDPLSESRLRLGLACPFTHSLSDVGGPAGPSHQYFLLPRRATARFGSDLIAPPRQ